MRLAGVRSVDSVQLLGHSIVAQILHLSWGGVAVVVAPLAMATEAVGVLNTEVKVLWIRQTLKFVTHPTGPY